MAELIDAGLLEDLKTNPLSTTQEISRQRYRPTQKLHAFVAMLEATPLPRRNWIDPRDGSKLVGHGIESAP